MAIAMAAFAAPSESESASGCDKGSATKQLGLRVLVILLFLFLLRASFPSRSVPQTCRVVHFARTKGSPVSKRHLPVPRLQSMRDTDQDGAREPGD